MKKSVISLISYDANRYLAQSIERYYDFVDEIILGLDKDRVTWSGNSFSINEEDLWSQLSQIDGDNKISIIEEDFHQSSVAIENDNYERNFLKGHCSNDWIFSIDADEWLVNAKDFFFNFCPLVEKYYNKYDLCLNWCPPYKVVQTQEGEMTLVIANEDDTPFFGENQGFATSKDSTFTYARWTDKSSTGGNRIMTPLVALHWSLCRPREELHQKINNIGHSDIVEEDPFYKIWSQVTIDNYKELENFKTSGLGGAQWPKVIPVPSDQVEEYIRQNLGRAY